MTHDEWLNMLAEESGVDLECDVASGMRTEVFQGHEIDSWYDENYCCWQAFCKGIGTYSDQGCRVAAIEKIKQKLA